MFVKKSDRELELERRGSRHVMPRGFVCACVCFFFLNHLKISKSSLSCVLKKEEFLCIGVMLKSKMYID